MALSRSECKKVRQNILRAAEQKLNLERQVATLSANPRDRTSERSLANSVDETSIEVREHSSKMLWCAVSTSVLRFFLTANVRVHIQVDRKTVALTCNPWCLA